MVSGCYWIERCEDYETDQMIHHTLVHACNLDGAKHSGFSKCGYLFRHVDESQVERERELVRRKKIITSH